MTTFILVFTLIIVLSIIVMIIVIVGMSKKIKKQKKTISAQQIALQQKEKNIELLQEHQMNINEITKNNNVIRKQIAGAKSNEEIDNVLKLIVEKNNKIARGEI